jgi:hypothetical protein
MRQWLLGEQRGVRWVIASLIVGACLGFSLGSGWFFDGGPDSGVTRWRQSVATTVRSTGLYNFLTLRGAPWDDVWYRFEKWAARIERDIEAEEYAKDPAHPRVFAVLREAVIREKGGYVHPDLGLMHPAPCGATRGLGMVRDSFHKCQTKCFPGTSEEKLELHSNETDSSASNSEETLDYRQEEVLLRIPLGYQMTRAVALERLLTLVPAEVQRVASLHELDDAALLVLLLAHERGVGRYSRWMPYIASMPNQPSCGYNRKIRSYMLNAIEAYKRELGVDVDGWGEELAKAMQYADKIAEGLNADYGTYIRTPEGISSLQNIQWALCQVASRATAGTEKHGSLRLVPILDLINHDHTAGGFIELDGTERMAKGDFLDATEDDSGTFVVRSLRHGRRKPLRKGQELLANYNVQQYSPLDWLISLGFVPEERWGPWIKIDPVLPRVRSDGPFGREGTAQGQPLWKEQDAQLRMRLKNSEL